MLAFCCFPSQVGLFRKSGVKSRIQALRQQCELSPDSVSYEDQSAYDVADMVKQFFRDLPEPLLTSKLGETFLHIYQCKSPLSEKPLSPCSQQSQTQLPQPLPFLGGFDIRNIVYSIVTLILEEVWTAKTFAGIL